MSDARLQLEDTEPELAHSLCSEELTVYLVGKIQLKSHKYDLSMQMCVTHRQIYIFGAVNLSKAELT